MSCPKWEESVARWVDGEGIADVEDHVAVCEGCRDLARELRADQSILREPVEVPDFAVAAVRARVRSAAGRRPWWIWTPAIAAAALTVAWGVNAWRILREPMPASLAPPPAIVAATVDRWPRWVEPPKPRRREVVTERQVRALRELFDEMERRARPAMRPPSSEVAMRLTTANPDVVIWVMQESKGESQ